MSYKEFYVFNMDFLYISKKKSWKECLKNIGCKNGNDSA